MLSRLASLTLLVTYILIILGAATRVFDAGMSCPDWPTCYGVWNPFHPLSAPEGGFVVGDVTYTVGQVALEWTHRLFAMGVGFLLLALGGLSWRHSWEVKTPLLVAFVLLGIQIGLGGLTVIKSNVNWSVALHLGMAMLVFGSLVWFRRAISAKKAPAPPTPWMVKLGAGITALAVWCTMVVGAFVSSSHAGGICGGLPDCIGSWLPDDMAQIAHMKHRYMAVITLIFSMKLISLVKRHAGWLKPSAVALHGMIWGQAAWGIATLYSFSYYPDFYQALSIAHLAWGTLVWMVAVGLLTNLRYGFAGRFHG